MLRKEFFRIFYDGDAEGGTGGSTDEGSNLFTGAKSGDDTEGDKKPVIDLGDGETGRPSWLPDKFWDSDKKEIRSETMARAYTETEREFQRVRQNLPEGVPKETADYFTETLVKDGKIILPEGLKNTPEIKIDEPRITALAELCRASGVPAATFEKLLPGFLKIEDELLGPGVNTAEEMESLGPNGKATIAVNLAYLESMRAQGTMTQEMYDISYAMFGTDAMGMKVLDALRVAAGNEPIPKGDMEVMPKYSKEDLFARQGDERYGVDKVFTDETDAAYEEVYGTEQTGSSEASGVGIGAAIVQDRKTVEEDFKTKR